MEFTVTQKGPNQNNPGWVELRSPSFGPLTRPSLRALEAAVKPLIHSGEDNEKIEKAFRNFTDSAGKGVKV